MAELNEKLLYETAWFARNAFAGVENCLHGRTDAARPQEAHFLRNLLIGLLDAQRADPSFRHGDMLEFFAFCLPRLKDSHAQIMQDLWALYMLGEKRGGFFVEFGACDGQKLSNTLLLERAYGWTGILAEPNPVWHEALKRNRTARICTDCVAARSGEVVEFLSADQMPELSRIAGIVPNDVHERNGNRDRQTRFAVNTISLNDLLESQGAPRVVDYLSLDTEGSEYEILRTTDFDRWSFRLISVEHAGETEKREAILTLLQSRGYTRWRPDLSRWDDWYVGPGLAGGDPT